jgi:hypothetical protein
VVSEVSKAGDFYHWPFLWIDLLLQEERSRSKAELGNPPSVAIKNPVINPGSLTKFRNNFTSAYAYNHYWQIVF